MTCLNLAHLEQWEISNGPVDFGRTKYFTPFILPWTYEFNRCSSSISRCIYYFATQPKSGGMQFPSHLKLNQWCRLLHRHSFRNGSGIAPLSSGVNTVVEGPVLLVATLGVGTAFGVAPWFEVVSNTGLGGEVPVLELRGVGGEPVGGGDWKVVWKKVPL